MIRAHFDVILAYLYADCKCIAKRSCKSLFYFILLDAFKKIESAWCANFHVVYFVIRIRSNITNVEINSLKIILWIVIGINKHIFCPRAFFLTGFCFCHIYSLQYFDKETDDALNIQSNLQVKTNWKCSFVQFDHQYVHIIITNSECGLPEFLLFMFVL